MPSIINLITFFVLRKSNEFIDKIIKPFDWTYTTKYNGTIDDPCSCVKVCIYSNF